jgi:hypothetical protein
MKPLLAIVLLASLAVPAGAAEDRKCIREMKDLYGDMATAKRQCDPRNFVTDPNEYGWQRTAPECVAQRVKGQGAKQQKDAACE